MMQLNFIEKTIFNLSLFKKGLLAAFITVGLVIIKIVATNTFLDGNSALSSADLSSKIGAYALWSDIIFCLAIVILFLGVFGVIKRQVRFTEARLSDAIIEGSLANPEEYTSTDEIGQLVRMACTDAQNIHLHVAEQRTAVLALEDDIEPILTCMEIVNESISEEFQQIELLATAMNEMTATVREVANNAGSASSSTTEAANVAQEGSQFVEATIATINSLSSNMGASADAVSSVEVKVEGIGSVVDTIRSISDQTNLLALNAAIEAARAGEAGRGFAVVADEVRNLAKRTQDSTVEIQGMIEQLQLSAEDAVSLMGKSVRDADSSVEQVTKAGVQLTGIVEKVHHISDMNYQIAASAEEQTTVAGEINVNLDQVKELVEGSVVVLKEITEMAEVMNQQIIKLKNVTEK